MQFLNDADNPHKPLNSHFQAGRSKLQENKVITHGILCKLKQFLLVALCFGASQTIIQHQKPFAYCLLYQVLFLQKKIVGNEKKLLVHNAKHKQELYILQLIHEIIYLCVSYFCVK